eukprot:CAMPEP_0202734204 /NCGR_PEP_ID=MMETSP1385-20130828/188557_1 /ASSEMBLY_ACC=CAM_ASM_000861 /TAXON_ID=933848 /ORGANISM="Elphidium margaritaceum" /LENGTH=392 /DNA_ID=CAMNT_0049400551 /DNA_START=365 /DNA_END=1543 /DNA_ORIENTATION=+
MNVDSEHRSNATSPATTTTTTTTHCTTKRGWGGNSTLLFVITMLVCSVVAILDVRASLLVQHTSQLSPSSVCIAFQITTMCFYTAVLLKVFCGCGASLKPPPNDHRLRDAYRDDWGLLMELFYLWFIIIFATVYGAVLASLNFSTHLSAVVLSICLQLSNLCNSVYCPWNVIERLQSLQRTVITTNCSLQQILEKKASFVVFTEHLVHELNIQKLAFLVEVWQFKYLNAKHTNEDDDEEKVLETACRLHSLQMDAGHETHHEPQRSATLSTSVTAASISIENENENAASSSPPAFFETLPWHYLPVSECIALYPNDKWSQCLSIYTKYIAHNSYFNVRVHESSIPSLPHHRSCKEKETLAMFDICVNDVLQHLNECAFRFVRSDEFKLLYVA